MRDGRGLGCGIIDDETRCTRDGLEGLGGLGLGAGLAGFDADAEDNDAEEF